MHKKLLNRLCRLNLSNVFDTFLNAINMKKSGEAEEVGTLAAASSSPAKTRLRGKIPVNGADLDDPRFWAYLFVEIMKKRNRVDHHRNGVFYISLEILEDTLIASILDNQDDPEMEGDSGDRTRSRSPIDWDDFLRQHQEPIFVPGLRNNPPSPRLSSLTKRQHEQCLAVLCYKKRHILPNLFVRRPTAQDYAAFEEVKQLYLQEQQEYIEWAKALWVNGHNLRALQPAVAIENVYLAEFNVRVSQVRDYPMSYNGTITISLDTGGTFEMRRVTTFQDVDTSNLPQLQYPEIIEERLTLQPTGDMLQPCAVHPVRFILPGQRNVTNLVATDIHTQLAEYAGARGVPFVARESALRCLVESRYWALTVSVCAVRWNDGQIRKVVVLGSEMTYKPEDPMTRTFRAYRRLLENAFVPPSELTKWSLDPDDSDTEGVASNEATLNANNGNLPWTEYYVPSNKYEDHKLFIFGEDEPIGKEADKENNDPDNSPAHETLVEVIPAELEETLVVQEEEPDREIVHDNPEVEPGASKIEPGMEKADQEKEIHEDSDKDTQDPTDKEKNNAEGAGEAQCICQDTAFGQPPPRSFRKWQFRSDLGTDNVRSVDCIVHCSHKFRGAKGEVLLEPIIEYQAELGASEQTDDRMKGIALALALRDDDTGVVHVRIDVQSGDVITIEELTEEQLQELKSPERLAAGGKAIHSTLNRLQVYEPGHYLLIHDSSDGEYALLYTEGSCYDQPSEMVFSRDADRARNAGSSSDLSSSSDDRCPSPKGYSGDCSRDEDFSSDADSSSDAGYSRVVGFSQDLGDSRNVDADYSIDADEEWSREANADCSRDAEVDWTREAKADYSRDADADCSPDAIVDCARDANADSSRNAEAACSLEPDAACSLEPDAACSLEPDAASSLEPDAACSLEPDAACSLEVDAEWSREANASFSRDTDADCFRDANVDCFRDLNEDCFLDPNADWSRDAAWQPSEEDKRYATWWHRVGYSRNVGFSTDLGLSHNSGWQSTRNVDLSRNASLIDETYSRNAASMRDAVSTRNVASSRSTVSSRNAASSRNVATTRNATSTRDAATTPDADSSDDGDQRDAGASRQQGATPTLPTPVLGTALLPFHKYRLTLPCAFTFAPENVIEERRPVATVKAPPKLPEPEWSPRKKWTKKKRGKKNLRPH